LLTLVFGALGMMSAQRPARMAGFAAIISSGTLMAVLGLARPEVTAGALYYMPASTFAVAAFFLLTELMDRSRQSEARRQLAPEDEEDHLPFSMAELELADGANLDDDEMPLIGRAIPAATALLGLTFIACTLLLAGLPPFSGFVGKVAMLSALFAVPGAVAPLSWVLMGVIIVSGLFALMALTRAGIRFFWAPMNREAPLLRVVEYVPIGVLVGMCVLLTVKAEVVMRYTQATVATLYQPRYYIDAVMSSRPLPTPTNADRLGIGAPEAKP
jgi:multicomponent K+:H+ antiporter subunit D